MSSSNNLLRFMADVYAAAHNLNYCPQVYGLSIVLGSLLATNLDECLIEALLL